jgi:hypothetical protein
VKKRKAELDRRDRLVALAKKRATTREFIESEDGPFLLGRGPQALATLRRAYNIVDPYAWRKPFVMYLWGGTGLGKSRTSRSWLRDTCRLPKEEVWVWIETDKFKWHNKYERQKAIILDDFTGDMTQKKLRNVLDGYEMPYEDKGGDIVHSPCVIIITSDRDIEHLELKGKDKEGQPIMMLEHEVAQIKRRVDLIIHYEENVRQNI